MMGEQYSTSYRYTTRIDPSHFADIVWACVQVCSLFDPSSIISIEQLLRNGSPAAHTAGDIDPSSLRLLHGTEVVHPMPPEKVDSHTGSIARALAVLEFLDGSQRGWNISQLSRKLEVPKSTMHLILLTLERLGYVSREPDSRDYSLSVKVCELGRSLMKNVLMPDIALPHLEDLVRQVRLTAHLAILEHDQAMYVQKVDCPGFIKFDTYVGKRTNLHCTAVGKVLLAYSTESKRDRILAREPFARYTCHTITSAILLRKELVNVRQRGYAIDDEEEELEVRCVAVPVFRPTGEFVAALGVTGTVGQMRPDAIPSLASRMRETGQNIIRGSRRTVGQRSA